MSDFHKIFIPSENRTFFRPGGTKLIDALRSEGYYPEAACGGKGKCGRCTVLVNGTPTASCSAFVSEDITVDFLPDSSMEYVGNLSPAAVGDISSKASCAAIDIGTTTLVCYVLDEDGNELSCSGALNPQTVFGADVVSRLREARAGRSELLSAVIREKAEELVGEACVSIGASPTDIAACCIVGNPTMQQLFLGMSTDNLVEIPYKSAIDSTLHLKASDFMPGLASAELIVPPCISAYVGADTLACILSCNLDASEEPVLLVDIGTNGEIALAANGRILCCATAAGPALEGADISCGTRACSGAIDSVSGYRDEVFSYTSIGNVLPTGICGSGLIDLVSVLRKNGLIDKRGHILDPFGDTVPVCGSVYLSQEDIRHFQSAKGAVAAGIEILTRESGIGLNDIGRVFLAGAFGSSINPDNACECGLLPHELSGRITSVGNAAGAGAKLILSDRALTAKCNELAGKAEYVDLGSRSDFPKIFAKNMYFK